MKFSGVKPKKMYNMHTHTVYRLCCSPPLFTCMPVFSLPLLGTPACLLCLKTRSWWITQAEIEAAQIKLNPTARLEGWLSKAEGMETMPDKTVRNDSATGNVKRNNVIFTATNVFRVECRALCYSTWLEMRSIDKNKLTKIVIILLLELMTIMK